MRSNPPTWGKGIGAEKLRGFRVRPARAKHIRPEFHEFLLLLAHLLLGLSCFPSCVIGGTYNCHSLVRRGRCRMYCVYVAR